MWMIQELLQGLIMEVVVNRRIVPALTTAGSPNTLYVHIVNSPSCSFLFSFLKYSWFTICVSFRYTAKWFSYTHVCVCVCVSCSVMSNSLQPHGLHPTGSSVHRDSLGKNTGVGCHSLLQGISPTQKSNPGLLHCRQILYSLSHQGSWRTDAKAETPILWPPDVKSQLIGKDPDAQKDWEGGDRRWDGWMAPPTQWIWAWANSGEIKKDREAWHTAVHGVANSQTQLEQLNNNNICILFYSFPW